MRVPVYYRRLQNGGTVRHFQIRISPGLFERRMARIRAILDHRYLSLSDRSNDLGGGVMERSFIPDFRDASILVRYNILRATRAAL